MPLGSEWQLPAITATLTAVITLSITFAYLTQFDRTPALRWWAAAFVAYALRMTAMLLGQVLGTDPVWTFLAESFSSLSGILLLIGTLSFADRAWPAWVYAALAAAAIGWAAVGAFALRNFLALTLPLYAANGTINIVTGLTFLRHYRLERLPGLRPVGLAFILWGLHKYDFPFLLPVTWFAPIGFLIAQVLALFIAFGLLIVALSRARRQALESEAAERRQRQVAETMLDATRLLGSTIELPAVLDQALDILARVVPFNSAAIFVREGERVRVRAGRGFPDPDAALRIDIAVDENPLIEVVARRGETLTLNDAQAEPSFARLANTTYVRGWLGVPLIVGERVIGQLTLDSVLVGAYGDDEARIAQSFARHVAIAIENARLFEAERTRARQLDALRATHLDAAQRLDLDDLLRVILVRSSKLVSAQHGYLDLVDTAANRVVTYTAIGEFGILKGDSLGPGEGLAGRVWATRQPLIVDDYQTWEGRLPRFAGKPYHAIVGVPILSGDDVIGVIGLGYTDPERRFTDDDVKLLEQFAEAASLAIVNARLTSQLEAHAANLERQVEERTLQLRAQAARLKELDRLKSEFVSNVSSELRSPLANVKLYQGLIRRGKPDKIDEYFATLDRETARLETLVESLLDISRFDLGQVSVGHAPIDLGTLVNNLVRDHGFMAAAHQLALRAEIEPGAPPVSGDAKLIAQVLNNLYTNAVHYTPSGGTITLGVRWSNDPPAGAPEPSSGPWVCLSVTDTGPGIPEAEYPHLFERFFRGSAARAAGVPGTGLGLAIAHDIVNLHGGVIEARSTHGQGATFEVWLPAFDTHDL